MFQGFSHHGDLNILPTTLDVTKLDAGEEPLAWVCSKIDPQLGRRRAISERMPLSMFSDYFQAEDGDAVEIYAELTLADPTSAAPYHIQFYEKASKRDFFLHEPSVTPGPVPAH